MWTRLAPLPSTEAAIEGSALVRNRVPDVPWSKGVIVATWTVFLDVKVWPKSVDFETMMASGWLLAFTLSIDDFVISFFVAGPGSTTLPIRIYSEVRLGVKPEINAVCTIMIAIVAVGTVASSLLAKRGTLRRERAALGAQV